jgi:predicted double-glycine peptidase
VNFKKILSAVANVAVIVAKDYTPQGRAISLLAHAVNVAGGGDPRLTLTPNIVSMIDADGDSVDDRIDADGGTVQAVTDEMLKAADNHPAFSEWLAGPRETYNFPFAAIYLAMYAARPQR